MIISLHYKGMELELKCKIICANSRRGSGKSILMRYIIKQFLDDFDKIFVISPTEAVKEFYGEFIHKENIFTEYNEEWVLKLIEKMTLKTKESDGKYNVLLVLDDCGCSKGFRESKALATLAVRGRHIHISVFYATQHIFQVPPVIRTQLDTLFIGQMNTQSLSILTEEFLIGNITKKDFIKLYYQSTTDHNFMVINNNSVTNNDDINLIYGKIKTPKAYI